MTDEKYPRITIIYDGLDNECDSAGNPNRCIQVAINKNKPGNDDFPDHITVIRYTWEKDSNDQWNVNLDVKRYKDEQP